MSVLSIFERTPSPRLIEAASITIEAPTEEYKQLAAKLGIGVATRPTSTLEDILREEMIQVYPMKAVHRYMDRITPIGKIWAWKACRNLDAARCRGHLTIHNHNNNGSFREGLYDKPIPFPALLTMDRIEEAAKIAGIAPAFFVSDYVARVPDPFLMVTIPAAGGSQVTETHGRLWVANPEPACFVVERWDEPSFREL